MPNIQQTVRVDAMQRRFLATIIAVTFTSWHPAAVGFSKMSISRVPDIMDTRKPIFKWGTPPYIAVLTEPDACMSMTRVEETAQALEQAVMCEGADLVVLRVDGSSHEGDCLKWVLLKRLAELRKKFNFLLVVNNDVDIVLKALSDNILVDGVHVKEHKAHSIPSVRSELQKLSTNIVIGTSCHSLQSAAASYNTSSLGPDYIFVGTCYLTQSHPEKESIEQLEGPSFPGQVKQELYRLFNDMKNDSTNDLMMKSESISKPIHPPVIFAIGGIDEQNCQEPVGTYGADGVAVIRTVMQASDPREVVFRMKTRMKKKCGGL